MLRIPDNEKHLNTPNSIRTFTGKYVDVFKPNAESICIEDIAHSLSMQCRRGGHLPKFYSVAEHSVLCARHFTEPVEALTALLHDASEAYMMDFPRPIKKSIPQYKEIEERLQQIICDKYGLVFPFGKKLHFIDDVMLTVEWNNMMLDHSKTVFECWTPEAAERNFLEMYNRLKAQIN